MTCWSAISGWASKAARWQPRRLLSVTFLANQQDFFSKLQLQRDQQLADTALKKLEHKNAMLEAAAEARFIYR